jgi:hypothetical protein
MAVTTITKNPRTLIAAATSNAAAGTTRGTLDLRTKAGGMLTIKLTNGATGPTVQAVANVLIAHNSGATPTAGSAGTDWKTIWSFGGGVTANAITEQSMAVDAAVMHIEVEVTGNTGQAVTCEAFLSELTQFDTV